MGSGFTKEQADLPFAVTTYSPAQRRPPVTDYVRRPSGGTPSSTAFFEEPAATALTFSPFARLRARRRTITPDANFDEHSSWWNEATKSDDDDEEDDDEYDYQNEDVTVERDASSQTNDDGAAADVASTVDHGGSETGLDSGRRIPEQAEPSSSAGAVNRKKSKNRPKLYPYAFAELKSFANINLCSSGIVKLSPNIGILQDANIIQICCNTLTSIPASITNLCNLTHLDLSNNQLTSLPASLGSLEKLLELRLSSNRLTSIPTGIKFLTRLQILAVAYNNLRELPSEMGALSALVDLDISGNTEIRWFPAEIGRLKFLQQLQCTGCNLLRKEDVIAEELRRCEQDARPPVLSLRELCARTILRIDPLYHTLFPDPSLPEVYPPRTLQSSSSSSNISQISNHPQQPRSIQRTNIIGSWKIRKSRSTDSLSSLSSHFSATSSSHEESTSRKRGKKAQPVRLQPIPTSILNYLESAHRCTFCGGPFLESYVSRFRFIPPKGVEADEEEEEDAENADNRLPLEYKLCTNHWNDEKGRIRAMFSPLPATAPGRTPSSILNGKYPVSGNLASSITATAAAGLTSGMRRSQSGVLVGLGRDRRESADGSLNSLQTTPHSRSFSSPFHSPLSKRSVLANNFRELKTYVLRRSRSGGLTDNQEGR